MIKTKGLQGPLSIAFSPARCHFSKNSWILRLDGTAGPIACQLPRRLGLFYSNGSHHTEVLRGLTGRIFVHSGRALTISSKLTSFETLDEVKKYVSSVYNSSQQFLSQWPFSPLCLDIFLDTAHAHRRCWSGHMTEDTIKRQRHKSVVA